jgi:DNA-binding transcriptional regulator YiaG
MNTEDRFTIAATNGMVYGVMNELRDLRQSIDLGQREFAAILGIPLETFRRWDSGRRTASVSLLQRAREVVTYPSHPW